MRSPERHEVRRAGGSPALFIAAAFLGLSLSCTPCQAQGEAPAMTAARVQAAASAVAADPLLPGTEKHKTLQFKKDKVDKKDDKRDEKDFGWWLEMLRNLSGGLRIAVWLLGAALLVWILLRLRDWLLAREGGPAAAPRLPTHVGQLDIRPESLPDDIGAEALRLWRAEEVRAALSLLYRGALSHLVHKHAVPIRAASTEGECLRLSAPRLVPASQDFLGLLVRNWQAVAYAQRQPEAAEIEQLCAEFDLRLSRAEASA
ncbi:DUF4129 domain-containing protein [Burkholderiaceae bacterium UC74_6]